MADTVQNRNFLSPLKFDFSIDRLPYVNFFTQAVNIPGINLPATANAQGTPFNNIPWQGDRISWGELSVEFKVDEDLNNWHEIFRWMTGIGHPHGTEQYAEFKKGLEKDLQKQVRPLPPAPKMGHIYGQGLLLIRNSQNSPILSVKFRDIYPSSLSELKFDIRDDAVNEIVCSVVFKYDLYEVVRP